MEERRVKIRIGLFVLGGLVLLSGFILVLGNIALTDGRAMVVHARASSGLKVRSPVAILGIRTGIVRGVALIRSGVPVKDGVPYPVRVELTIPDEDAPLLKDDLVVSVRAATLLGEKLIYIEPGTPAAPPYDWTRPVFASSGGGMEDAMAAASKVAGSLDRFLGETDILQKGSSLIDELSETLAKVNGHVDHLVGRADGLLDALHATLTELRAVLAQVEVPKLDPARVDRLLAKVERALDATNEAIPAVSRDARALLADARALTGDLTRIGQEAGGHVGDSLGRVNGLIRRLDEGEGLISLLLRDREIYYDMKELVRDLKLHPWKVLWKE